MNMNRNPSQFLLPPDDAETRWLAFEQLVRTDAQAFFDSAGPIAGARAPGRLDVMGGVADYSGSLVLEMPIAEAACAAWQWREDRQIRVRSLGIDADGLLPEVVFSLDDLVDSDGYVLPLERVRQTLTADPTTRWASYVVGCYYVMLTAYSRVSQGMVDSRLGELGANVLIHSEVPLGAGVSSSAALEVATMHALSAAAGIEPSDMTLAAWCQRVENTIVGAPCGIMDQVTSALGRENALLLLRCQPHDLLGNQRIPPGWRFVGLDSRIKHSVGGSAYTRARIGAFMGLKVIQLESGGKLLDNYLCNMKPEEFAVYREMIPESITGAEYHDLYGLLPDTVTRVDPAQTYFPRACAEHPILENARVAAFVSLMHIAGLRAEERETSAIRTASEVKFERDQEQGLLIEAGRLLYEAHSSYGDRLGLGSPETDLLIRLVRERGIERGLYGARITGGGAGGTVAILCADDSPDTDAALIEICVEYERQIGILPRSFVGSSPGAVMFGARQIMRG